MASSSSDHEKKVEKVAFKTDEINKLVPYSTDSSVRDQILMHQVRRNPRILRPKKHTSHTAFEAYKRTSEQTLESLSDVERFYLRLRAVRADDEAPRKREKMRLKEQTDDMIRERLLTRGDCDLINLGCTVPKCGRMFDTLRILAWHMSYSHTDADSDNQMHANCLVCDRQLKSVKGKNSHLVTAHRDLCILHNSQCVQQRQPQSAIMASKLLSAEESTLEHLFLVDAQVPYELDADMADEDVAVDEEPPPLDLIRGIDESLEQVIVVDDY